MDPGYDKPLPLLTGMTQALTGEFYRWCRAGELRFQRCTSCGRFRHVPRPMCPACGSWESEWTRSTGRGRVVTWTVVTRPMHPAFTAVPYAPVVIELDEGVRVVSTITDCPPAELQRGLRVRVVFDAVTEAVTLPGFERDTEQTE
ncbi:MAG: DNA-binding protein [Gammaproteobacteria bacterium]|nr:DNA-binding protein [Gammaproteobacteria bacterium]